MCVMWPPAGRARGQNKDANLHTVCQTGVQLTTSLPYNGLSIDASTEAQRIKINRNLLSITSPNIDGFSKFFHSKLSKKFEIK